MRSSCWIEKRVDARAELKLLNVHVYQRKFLVKRVHVMMCCRCRFKFDILVDAIEGVPDSIFYLHQMWNGSLRAPSRRWPLESHIYAAAKQIWKIDRSRVRLKSSRGGIVGTGKPIFKIVNWKWSERQVECSEKKERSLWFKTGLINQKWRAIYNWKNSLMFLCDPLVPFRVITSTEMLIEIKNKSSQLSWYFSIFKSVLYLSIY